MNLLPYKKYWLLTKLTPEEVVQKLSCQIEPLDNMRFVSFGNTYYNTRPYEGYILNDKFKIQRIDIVNHKFPTIVKGTIIEDSNGAEVNIIMRLNGFTLILMSVFLSVIMFCIFQIVREIIKSIPVEPPVLFIVSFMFVIAIVTPLYIFQLESEKAQKFLASLLEEES